MKRDLPILPPPTRDAAPASLRDKRGAAYWRSVEELAGSEQFQEMLHRELPRHASEWDGSVDRRRFLQLAGASLGLAGLTACTRQPLEKIVPYVTQPEALVPGNPLYFATAMTRGGYASGLLVESHVGRPTKVEGNPEHPASLGATDLFAQASVLGLYDPDRSRAITEDGEIRTWERFLETLSRTLTALGGLEGDGLRILTGTVTSPTLGALLARLQDALPKARWHRFEAIHRDSAQAGARAAFANPLAVRYDLSRADVIVAVGADLLTDMPGSVRYASEFAARRRAPDEPGAQGTMSRLYTVDVAPTATSAAADHRLAVKPSELDAFVLALAARLRISGASTPEAFAQGESAFWVNSVADDLAQCRGRGLVAVGDGLSPEAHTLALAINDKLGNLGTTVLTSDPVVVEPVDQTGSLRELVADLEAGVVDTLLVLDANPVYETPADVDFAAAMEKARLRVHLGLYDDETAAHCQWHIPAAHYLETWSDARAYDGTVSIAQPLIEPLYDGKSVLEMVAALLGEGDKGGEALVREHWQTASAADTDFQRFWRRALHDGVVPDTALPHRPLPLRSSSVRTAAAALARRPVGAGLELAFTADPTIYDGRFANNPWLQECPKPLTKLTWDNALLTSPKTARDLGLGDLIADHDQWRKAPLVTVSAAGYQLTVPVWVLPGHADGALTLYLGYGRERCGRVGDGIGFDANRLRTVDAQWQLSTGVEVVKAGGRYALASTQEHHHMEGRDLVRSAGVAAYAKDHHLFEHGGHGIDPNLTMMDGKDFPYDGYAWGMTVDLSACTGCNACVVACQSENNIPTVGKEQVLRGREMHWIRIDRYFEGEDVDHVGEMLHQPVLCQQCEEAPCEVVCPVAATVHSDEGLNDMVYNRCVGTRYCSNNCPYKVRRFNFLLYQDFETPSLQLGRNPDVTVRSRGVMEKCTYCVQRINQTRIVAKRDGRKIRDGEIQTACQQACPSDALTFGDINDPQSQVTVAKESPRNYSLLGELGTRPRTTYLARLRNPNPRLEPPEETTTDGHGGHG